MKKKILVLLLLLSGVFSFGSIYSKAQAEFINDYTFVVSNSTYDINEEDIINFLFFLDDYVNTYNIPADEDGIYDIGNNLYGEMYIDFNADLSSLYYTLYYGNYIVDNRMSLTMLDYINGFVFNFVWDRTNDETHITAIAEYDFTVTITLFEPEPPFTGLINFISNFLQDMLKSITDTTMYLINNIWDTNLIDINLVILSDTAIYTGTLNDLLYSVFSIFYVIFAITVVWRLLKKLLRKLFSIVRW